MDGKTADPAQKEQSASRQGSGKVATPADGSTAMVAMNSVGGNAVGKLVAVDPRVSQLIALAKELGYALSPLDTMRKELSVSISTRLVTRVGIDVYQKAAYNIPMFSREAALQIFPDSLKTTNTASVVTWRLETRADVVSTLGPISLSERCAGISRALKTPSELFIRVVATLMPGIKISYVKKSGLDRLYINFMYLLSDEAGELHPPKDNERREIGMDPVLVTEMREQILLDVDAMAKTQLPLSAGYYRQLGYDTMAMHTEAMEVQQAAALTAGAAAHTSIKVQAAVAAGKKAPIQRARKRQCEEYDVEAIVAQRSGRTPYLVRWAGYHALWDVWRIPGRGEAGDPVETWEPKSTVADTVVLQQWHLQASSGSSSGV